MPRIRLSVWALALLVAAFVSTPPAWAAAPYTVLLHSRQFVPPPGISGAIPSGNRVHALVQLVGYPTSAQLAQLRQLGLTLLVRVPDRAWLASFPPSAVTSLAAHPAVRAIVGLVPNDRVSAALRDGVDPRLVFPNGTIAVEVRVYDDVAMATARSTLASIVQILAEDDRTHTFLVRGTMANLLLLDDLEFVQLVDEVPPPAEEDLDQTRIDTNASRVQIVEDTVAAGVMTGTQAGSPYALDGQGVAIGQWEPRRPDTCQADFQGRLRADGTFAGSTRRVRFGDGDGDGLLDTDCASPSYQVANDTTIGDHATHVAGIVLGNGAQSAGAGGLALQWRGMAPNASLFAYTRPNLDTDADGIAEAAPVATHGTQYDDALARAVQVSVNSWGYTHCHQIAATCYDRGAELYDDLVAAIDDPDRSEALSIVGSSGNQGPTAGTGATWGAVRIPNSAKNTIEVGSISSDLVGFPARNQLAGSSSRGPVDDGRLKPEVVAPGTQAGGPAGSLVSSTVMTIFTDDASTPGVCPAGQGTGCTSDGRCGNGTDDCAAPYDNLSGTSMATPAVTGAAALLVQQFRRRQGEDPWPSTVKALLVHTAVDQCCSDANNSDADGPGPDFAYGYGKIDVQAAADLLRDRHNGHVVEAPGFGAAGSCPTDATALCDLDGNGDSDDDEYDVTLPPGLAGWRATLVWDDLSVGGSVLARGAPALVNDLDLFLVAPDGTVTRPWVLNPAQPANAATRARDALNVVEVVDLPNPMAGTWTIHVRPTVISPPSDLLPAQRYTLVYESYRADVMIRDHAEDDGGVPSVTEGPDGWSPVRYWQSPAITIEGGESIDPGVQKRLHVVVTNHGNVTVEDSAVQLYWSNANVGRDYADFLANPMGLCLVDSLAPGESSDPAECEILYTFDAGDLVVGADGSAHVCLLATVLAIDDGITFPGYATVPAGANPSPSYVPWDDNLAQQNVADEFTDDEDGTLDFEVHNPSDQQTRSIEVVLDTTGLPPGWGVQLLPNAVFPLPPNATALAHLTLTPPPGAPDGAVGRVSAFSRDAITKDLLHGGVVFEVHVGSPDADGDGVADTTDNCRFAPNPTQKDTGGIGTSSGPDGIGDACQCGDVSGDGRVTLGDSVIVQRSLLVPPTATLVRPELCDVGAGAGCTLSDAVVLRRALLVPPTATIVPQCGPAMP
jgi:subtilisin family serine protease